ncbi:hypothetical protein FGIG_12291 [Fasciola gigantica]|uniref:Uncharacterized protein n=1 Tax=Fasciola gigantica TaxID=46835 RepID=A0A504YB03_FASGI|nr:hypothetical protein FGIG_12291 [Fasciola gigantica]
MSVSATRTEKREVACDKEEDENDNGDLDDKDLGGKDSLSDYDDDDVKQSRSAGRHREHKTVSAHCPSASSPSSSSSLAPLPPTSRLLPASTSHPSSTPSIVLTVSVRPPLANSTPKEAESISERKCLS